ncbi:MAG: glycosyltransferase family 4 protein [Patescibacteria group bacterium]|jgi:phosphatidylinositol alpha-1,6-mannosyltransferase
MRFLIFTLEYPPFKGGVGKYYEDMAKNWPEGREIFVLDNNDGKLVSSRLPRYKWLPSIWRLWVSVNKNKINHILVGHVLPLGIAAFIVNRLAGIKYSIVLHGMDYLCAFKTERKSWVVQKIFYRAEKIICANSYVAGLLAEELGEKIAKKIVIINPGVDGKIKIDKGLSDKLKTRQGLKNKIVLLSISRLVKRKGFDYVIESMPEILKAAPQAVYVVGGIGPDEEYLKEKWQALPEEVKKKVIFIGKPDDKEKWAWLSACDIFVMPSRKINGDVEGFGIVYLEANLAGKPVIAGDSGGVRDAVSDQVNGLLVNPDDKDDIVRAIVSLVNNKALREAMGEKARLRVLEEYSAKGQAKKLYEAVSGE